MSYRDIVGYNDIPNDDERNINLNGRKVSRYLAIDDYDQPRLGLPSGALKHKKVKKELKIVIDHFILNGYSTPPYGKLSLEFKRHLILFRTKLDLWESINIEKCMTKDEIYFRCLTDGHLFTEYVKKCRSSTLRYLTSETNSTVEEQYLLPNYHGYDSMFSERDLIHWDDTDEIDDIKYAFIPCERERKQDFELRVDKMFEDFRISECNFSDSIDMIAQLKNTMMYDAKKGKTHLMRNFWNRDVDTRTHYFAVRKVVPIPRASTRDAGVGTPATILKVKMLNQLARTISEKIPYSANASLDTVSKRIKRVLKKNSFLHLDFKKFGLTFPRYLMNTMIKKIGEYANLDLSDLLIDEFFVEIDKEVYQTARGSMLGWLDPINSLCVCAILHYLSCERELRFDFVTYNDDVEISKRFGKDPSGGLELLRSAVVIELDSYDIPISLDKTYGSKASIFLEKYNHFHNYGLDMRKHQLSINQHAAALCTPFAWMAKMYFAEASTIFVNDYIADRFRKTTPIEFRPNDFDMSLWAGGARILKNNRNLDEAFNETDELGIYLGIELSKFRIPNYTVPMDKVSSNRSIEIATEQKCYNANSASLGRLVLGDVGQISDINEDIPLIKDQVEHQIFEYAGRGDDFPLRVSWVIGGSLRSFDKDNP